MTLKSLRRVIVMEYEARKIIRVGFDLANMLFSNIF